MHMTQRPSGGLLLESVASDTHTWPFFLLTSDKRLSALFCHTPGSFSLCPRHPSWPLTSEGSILSGLAPRLLKAPPHWQPISL